MHPTSKSSGDLGVSSAQLHLGKSVLTGVNIHAAAADVVVTIYDNTAASGKIIFKYTLDITQEGLAKYLCLPAVRADLGLFVVVTGAAANVIVHWR